MISLQPLSPGIYHVVINDKGKRYNERLVIQ